MPLGSLAQPLLRDALSLWACGAAALMPPTSVSDNVGQSQSPLLPCLACLPVAGNCKLAHASPSVGRRRAQIAAPSCTATTAHTLHTHLQHTHPRAWLALQAPGDRLCLFAAWRPPSTEPSRPHALPEAWEVPAMIDMACLLLHARSNSPSGASVSLGEEASLLLRLLAGRVCQKCHVVTAALRCPFPWDATRPSDKRRLHRCTPP